MKRVVALASSIIFILTCGCSGSNKKVYADEMMEIDSTMSSIFYSSINDNTFFFKNVSGIIKTFAVNEVDSSMINEKGPFISAKPYKMVWCYFSEKGVDSTSLDRRNHFFITNSPEDSGSGISIQFNNLYYSDTILPVLKKDTIQLNDKKFYNYYEFKTSLPLKRPNDVEKLYIVPKKGIVGFVTLSGEAWVKIID